jgi:hypothetical protein
MYVSEYYPSSMGPKGPFKIGLLDRSILGKGPIYSEESALQSLTGKVQVFYRDFPV